MVYVEKISSRGVAGAELEALVVARLCGLATGGNTRIGRCRRTAGVIARYGLACDGGARRQVLLRNIRSADGTLVFGRLGRETEALLKSQGAAYARVERPRPGSAGRVLEWMAHHNVRTLNVIGPSGAQWAFIARLLLVDLLRRMGRAPILPADPAARGAEMVATREGIFAGVLWPRRAEWRWLEHRRVWEPATGGALLEAMKNLGFEAEWASERLWKRVPWHVRQWVGSDGRLLDVFGRLGKPAEDLACAGRWGILNLVAERAAALCAAYPSEKVWSVMGTLLLHPQRQIAGLLGFQATESAARILGKVSRRFFQFDELRRLTLDPATCKILRALPRIDGAVIDALACPELRRIIAPRLLYAIAARQGADENGDETAMLVFSLRLHRDRLNGLPGIGVLHSVRALRAADCQLELTESSLPLPPAPPALTGVVEPLADRKALGAEGRQMRHCVATYAPEVLSGRTLIYRILPDDSARTGRATLQLTPDRRGQWAIRQLRGPGNSPVTPATEAFVRRWLAEAQVAASGLVGCAALHQEALS